MRHFLKPILSGAPLSSLFLALAIAAVSLSTQADSGTRIKLSGLLNGDQEQRVAVRDIEAVGVSTLEAYNPYEERTETYTGVWMDQFVAEFGAAEVQALQMSAIDNYSIAFNADEWSSMRIMIATQTDGEYMGFDRKGPMRIIFPDYDPKLEAYQVNLPKWMWMITEIEFK